MSPRIIKGNIFKDHRGTVAFVNDFNFKDIARFYIIENSEQNNIRAWQGHKIDEKNFYCVQGSFLVAFIKIDNWENPSSELIPECVILNSDCSDILHIPAGYANAIKSLEPNSKLISFSTLQLDKSKEDEVRYDKNKWNIP